MHFEKSPLIILLVIHLDSNVEEVAQRADILERQVTSVLTHRGLRTQIHREWECPGIVGKVTSEEVEHARSADTRLVCRDEIQAGWVSIQDVLIGFLHRRL
jgi:hypothetical protein